MPREASAGGSARRVLAVAGITFREAWRRKVVLAAVAMAAAYLGLYWLGAHYTGVQFARAGAGGPSDLMQRAGAAQLLYLGLFPTSFIVALTAVFASAGAISGEVDSGVMAGVLTRPVRRWEVVTGKAIGLASMLVLFSVAVMGGLIGIAVWQMGSPVKDALPAMALFTLEPLLLLALALLGSARLPTLANGVLCTAAYGIGFIGGLIEQIGAVIGNSVMTNIGIVSSLLVPLDAVHRKAVALLLPGGLLMGGAGGGPGMPASATPSVWMVVYAVGYVVALVGFSALVFKRRDL